MNTAVHIMQTVDWSKYDLPDWLRQCGAWQRSCKGGKQAANPIAVAMQKAKVRLKKKDRAKLIAYYLCDTQELQQTAHHKVSCQITDDEARAVQRLVLDIINGTDSEATLEWMDTIIGRYFHDRSWAELETPDRTVMDAKYDVRCGLAALHVRYSFIRYVKGTV
ncbi:hypothetical protein QTA56_03560 [Acinetobacter sp. VNH17]|uniref:Phage antitermination protein Q n=1 Tax=Acinetobacter thutiue TaxID=2998078 RepID=A0ABT7WKV2_9GAMM|nr:hypothetical protein [Acinetobacter thutiue]MCY6411216.1 hypothetical protein [Acinetobacter thutiue]MDN0013318.1 hypothetical protein [Acinetobacter thutiue]